jgi:hypothetical protein
MIALLLTACSSTQVPERDHVNFALGPLDEFLARISGWEFGESLDEVNARQAQTFRREQELIAECMTRQGFLYFPNEVRFVTVSTPDHPLDESWPLRGSREFAEQFGFAIISGAGINAWTSEPIPNWIDPNAEHLASLTENERDAWNLALLGDQDSDPANWATEAGCWGEAIVASIIDDSQFDSLSEEIISFRNALSFDARVVSLNESWVQCMGKAGYGGFNWNSPPTLKDWLFTQEQLLYGGWMALLNDWDWEKAPEGPVAPSASSRSELAALEITLAVADWDCRNDIGYDAALHEIYLELQQLFVDQHRHELESWLLYVEERRASLNRLRLDPAG